MPKNGHMITIVAILRLSYKGANEVVEAFLIQSRRSRPPVSNAYASRGPQDSPREIKTYFDPK